MPWEMSKLSPKLKVHLSLSYGHLTSHKESFKDCLKVEIY
ncbi:hypothetical protein ISN45_At03g038480 [Arabidopsis thaliana x Arabidopsis arenosa]|uniref:Uncharacterized protein n=2 Tax=Arabidopsis TaxID=3701 RepID=A0A8T2FH53_ARASU|nr:hypothetical protein ISN45_At03g038480 [Arabidopsis thaliana x Arabidopsis arenosa]KAG7633463.1 hypothetical protein ISN44_As03g037600 [Arabidopsis suecica]